MKESIFRTDVVEKKKGTKKLCGKRNLKAQQPHTGVGATTIKKKKKGMSATANKRMIGKTR